MSPCTPNQMLEAINRTVNSHQGIKGVDLVIQVMGHINPCMFDQELYSRTLEFLVATGEVVELEYTLASMEYRIKSIYFPKGTQFNGASKQHAEINDGHIVLLPRP